MMGEEAVEVQKYVRHQGEIADADILARLKQLDDRVHSSESIAEGVARLTQLQNAIDDPKARNAQLEQQKSTQPVAACSAASGSQQDLPCSLPHPRIFQVPGFRCVHCRPQV